LHPLRGGARSRPPDRTETVLALTVTSLVVFLVAVFSHVISIRLSGTTVESTIRVPSRRLG
jgi:uncharacterized paraquat-inducible protein A